MTMTTAIRVRALIDVSPALRKVQELRDKTEKQVKEYAEESTRRNGKHLPTPEGEAAKAQAATDLFLASSRAVLEETTAARTLQRLEIEGNPAYAAAVLAEIEAAVQHLAPSLPVEQAHRSAGGSGLQPSLRSVEITGLVKYTRDKLQRQIVALDDVPPLLRELLEAK